MSLISVIFRTDLHCLVVLTFHGFFEAVDGDDGGVIVPAMETETGNGNPTRWMSMDNGFRRDVQ